MMILQVLMALVILQVIIFTFLFPKPQHFPLSGDYDCAIVCGCPADDDGKVTNTLKSRCDKAIEIYHQGYCQYLLMSGGAAHNQYVEAQVMKEYALLKGVKEENIVIETKSLSTYHNMMYCEKIVKEHHWIRCLVVTNSWHLRKTNHYAKKFHLNYQMIQAEKPEGMSWIRVGYLHVYMYLTTYFNLLKGLY